MKTIAFDIMGNDNGIKGGVEAAITFVEKNLDYTFILVGDKQQINKYTKETERIRIIDNKNEIDKSGGIRSARNSDSSMSVAINLVKTNQADAVISSGESGIYLSMATLQLKRIPGVVRPAFMPIFPTIIKNKRFAFLDAGANLETNAKMLVQWADFGKIFSSKVLKTKNPKVGIINIGTEDTKGHDFHKEAHEILKKNKDINYVGFVEPRELLNGVVDVAVVDGYAGNMVLKSMEGAVLSLLKLIRSEIKSKFIYKIGALFSRGAFRNVKEVLDYRNVGGGWVVGLQGLAIKAHGSSDKKAYLGALNQIKEALENQALQKIKEAIGGKDD